MIVCHCNRIDHREIEAATERLLAADPHAIVTPAGVYACLGKRPRCGGCLALATSIIYAHLPARAATAGDCPALPALTDAAPGAQGAGRSKATRRSSRY